MIESNLKLKRKHMLELIQAVIDYVNGTNLQPMFSDQNIQIKYESILEDVSCLMNDELFKIKFKEFESAFIYTQEKLRSYGIEKLAIELSDEISQVTVRNQNLIQCVEIEFDHYHSPEPLMKYWGSGEYHVLNGSEYLNSDFYGTSIYYGKSEINFSSILKELNELEWLEDEFELSGFFYEYFNYLLVEIYYLLASAFNDIDKSSQISLGYLLKPCFIYAKQRDEEPVSIAVIQN